MGKRISSCYVHEAKFTSCLTSDILKSHSSLSDKLSTNSPQTACLEGIYNWLQVLVEILDQVQIYYILERSKQIFYNIYI